MKLSIPSAVFALMATVVLSGCATPSLQATTDFDSEFSFSSVKKIAIQPAALMNSAAVLVSDMGVNRMNSAFTDELARKNLKVVADSADADMYLVWHLVTQEKTDVRSYNSASYYSCWRCGPAVSDVTVRHFIEGTLIVDMVDPERGQSVWRSIVHSRLKGGVDAEESEALRAEAARALFADFPSL